MSDSTVVLCVLYLYVCICVYYIYTVVLLMGGLNQEKDEGCPLLTVVSSLLGCIKDKTGPLSKKSHSFLFLSSLSFWVPFSLSLHVSFSPFLSPFLTHKKTCLVQIVTQGGAQVCLSHTRVLLRIYFRRFF